MSAATCRRGLVPPVEVHVGAEVVAVDAQATSVTLSDGQVFVGMLLSGRMGFGCALSYLVHGVDWRELVERIVYGLQVNRRL